MYIIFGRKSSIVKDEMVIEDRCPVCEQERKSVFGLVKYVHLFWIPVFAYKTELFTICHHCKHHTEFGATDIVYSETKKSIFTKGKLIKYNFLLVAFLSLMGISFISAGIRSIIAMF